MQKVYTVCGLSYSGIMDIRVSMEEKKTKKKKQFYKNYMSCLNCQHVKKDNRCMSRDKMHLQL